ncbi:hypothetical protein PRZ48_004022 [Zasmidium cellare]|uniref:Uncharacterized protein n=1 Tax=Zasmidium cellare TaxID=395010 RepID=A0ABR0EWP9_ZASCE|nr:hypothetical protein PRZ48_004022 [Zasmidium cellare]
MRPTSLSSLLLQPLTTQHHQLRTILLAPVIYLLARLCLPTTTLSKEILDVHSTLATFAQRGQTSVEPALSFLSILIPAEGNLELEVLLVGIWVGVAAAVLRSKSATAVFAVILFLGWNVGQGGLSISHGLGDGAICLAMLSGERSYLSEGLLLLGYAFGSNSMEAYVAYLLLLGRRVEGVVKKIPDTKISCVCFPTPESSARIADPTQNTLVYLALCKLFAALFFWPTVFLTIAGLFLPFSEKAGGGNYGLHHLSAPARRDITPFASLTARENNRALFGIVDSKEMYTLYVPSAGFLWSDEMVWAQSMPGREDYAVESSERVFFQDKFVERYPWIVQVKEPPKTRKKKQPKREVVRSGSTVHVKSWIRYVALISNMSMEQLLTSNDSNRYICLIPGERVFSEAGYFDDRPEGEQEGTTSSTSNTQEPKIQRIRVGHVDSHSHFLYSLTNTVQDSPDPLRLGPLLRSIKRQRHSPPPA